MQNEAYNDFSSFIYFKKFRTSINYSVNFLTLSEAVHYNRKSSLQFGYSQSRSMLLNHLCYQWSSKNKAIDHEMNFVTSLM